MGFWAKKQGFLVELPEGVDQKAGMMTFERVMSYNLLFVKECRDGLLDLTFANDGANDNGDSTDDYCWKLENESIASGCWPAGKRIDGAQL